MSRTIYEGSISVVDSEHVHSVSHDDGDSFVDVPIDGLDDRVTRLTHLRFALEYPFDKPYESSVVSDDGATLRQIIDAVRSGFRIMYRGASQQAIPHLSGNQIVDGNYGRAFHDISDLVIEIIELDEETATLDITIGS